MYEHARKSNFIAVLFKSYYSFRLIVLISSLDRARGCYCVNGTVQWRGRCPLSGLTVLNEGVSSSMRMIAFISDFTKCLGCYIVLIGSECSVSSGRANACSGKGVLESSCVNEVLSNCRMPRVQRFFLL